jgi:plasmid stabilization system protein ParE
MTYRVRYTRAAKNDLVRRYGFLVEEDLAAARKALEVNRKGIEFLREFPFSCRKAADGETLPREMLIPFGARGYVVLFEIEDRKTVTILAIRHQREEDYF